MSRAPEHSNHVTNRDRIERRIGDCTVALRSELPELLADFARVYLDEPTGDDRRPRIEMDVRRYKRRLPFRRLYQVYGDGETVGGPRPPDQIFPFLEWGINLRVIERLNQYLLLHAASLEHGGSGFIFAGSSGCGKSTLAAGLMARNWKYYCDEFALVSPASLFLHAFPKALCIKAGSFNAISDLGAKFSRKRDYIKGLKGRVGYLSPHAMGPDAVAAPAPVRYIIFPRFVEGRAPQLRPISRGRAMFELVKCVFNRRRFGDEMYSVLAVLVRGAQVFELCSGDLSTTCDLIETQLCGRVGVTQRQRNVVPISPLAAARESATGISLPPSRREVLRFGAKLAYVAPAVITLSATEVFAQVSNPSGLCSTAAHSGDPCENDSDCCTNRCNFGIICD